MNVLVIGGGSIGKRHVRNLRAMGVEQVGSVDPREDRRAEAQADGATAAFASLDDALAAGGWQAAVIANPTGLHIQTGLALAQAGLHLFIEKPLDKDLTGADDLLALTRDKGLVTFMAFCLRYSESALRLKDLLDQGAVGRPIFVRGEYSSYLPNWHKYEDYRKFYMASVELGGGALLDECHIIDLAYFLVGEFERVYAEVNKVSDLEIETDDCYDLLIATKAGVPCNLHGDIFSRPARDAITVVGTEGSLHWDMGPDAVSLKDPLREKDEAWTATEDRNQMYIAEMEAFFGAIKSGKSIPGLDLAHGMMIQKVLLGARANSGQRPFSLE